MYIGENEVTARLGIALSAASPDVLNLLRLNGGLRVGRIRKVAALENSSSFQAYDQNDTESPLAKAVSRSLPTKSCHTRLSHASVLPTHTHTRMRGLRKFFHLPGSRIIGAHPFTTF